MRTCPRLGAANAALISIYFVPVWGGEALRALTSPFNGFEDRAHAVAAAYYRAMFDLSLDGLVRTANTLAVIKFVIAVGFVAYLIDFARALVVDREPNRETLDIVLLLASAALMLWAWPALAAGEGSLIRVDATQFLMLTGAMIVLLVERHVLERARAADVAMPAGERMPQHALPAPLTVPAA
jgi:hypothetical protein